MSVPQNIFEVKMDVVLSGNIMGHELLRTDPQTNELSSHYLSIPPNEEYPPHVHPSEHAILVVEGTGYATFWDGDVKTRYILKKGDFFHVPANVPHQVGAFEKGATMLAVSVNALSLHDPNRLTVVEVK